MAPCRPKSVSSASTEPGSAILPMVLGMTPWRHPQVRAGALFRRNFPVEMQRLSHPPCDHCRAALVFAVTT
jgi:hypothetical protein